MRGPVLFCAATAVELEAAQGIASDTRLLHVTGVGIPMTLARLPGLIAGTGPSLIVNFGIAGAYPGSGLAIGDLVLGESEVFGDLGLELPGPDAFLPIRETPWADGIYRQPLALYAGPLAPFSGSVKAGKGCTVNACTGTRATGERRRRQFAADFETMEGAAAALAGSLAGVPVAELRAISNIAADRDMRTENVALALGNLRFYLESRREVWP